MNRMNAAWSRVGGIAILLTALGAPQSASAALYVHEGFDYPNDSPIIHGANGGTGWTAGWDDTDGDFANLSNDDASLSNPAFPYATVGDRVEGGPSGTAAEVNRLLPTTFDMSQDGVTLFASFLFKKSQGSGTVNNNVEFNFFASNGSIQVARFGSGSGDQFFLHTGTNLIPGSITLDHTYFMVLKVVSSELSDDQFYAKVYDGSASVPTAEPTEWDATWEVNSMRVIDNIRLIRGANGVGAADEIRVGSTWGDVAGGAVTPGLTADFDGDLDVDGNDFLIWQRNYLATGDVAGDANDDGVVDGLDLGIWKEQFVPAATPAVASIPEPATALLATCAALAFAVRARRKS